MAGPNQTGDNNKKAEDEALRNEEAAKSLSDSNNDTQNLAQDATIPPVQIVTEAKKDDAPTLDQDIEPLITPEEIASTMGAEESVMVGRDANNIGDNATSNATLDAAELISSGPDAQDIENDAHKNETQYGFGADAAAKQMNDALSGAGEGKTNTTFTARTADAQEQKRREDSLANIRTINMSADIAAAYVQLAEDVQAMGDALDKQSIEIDKLTSGYDAEFKKINVYIDAGEKEVATLKQELEDLNNAGLSPTELTAQQKKISDELKTSEEQLSALKLTLLEAQKEYDSDLAIAKAGLTEAQNIRKSLAADIATGERSENPGNQIDNLNSKMLSGQRSVENNEINISSASGGLERFKIKADALIQGMSNDNALTKGNDLVSMLASAAGASGNINQDQLETISKQLNAYGISKEDKNEFINSFTALGGTITIKDPENHGQDKILSGDDVTKHLQSEWDAIKEDIDKTEAKIEYTNEGKDALVAEIAALKAQRQTLTDDLKTAETTLQKEQTESVEAAAGAEEIGKVTLEYDSVYDYMSTNYSTTIFGISVGDGENIDDVANDPNRILTYNDKLVYVSADTQEMYTLDANGEKVDIPPVDTIKLYQKMYAEKLLPRNFVEDEGGAHKEYSKHDSFNMSMAKSLLPGNMTAEQTQSLIDKAAKIEAQEAQEAQIATDKAQGNIHAAQGQVDDLKGKVNQADYEIANLEAKLEQHNVALAEVEQKQASISSDSKDDNDASKIAAKDTTATQWEGKETHDMAIPDHDLATAETSRNAALKEVEIAALNGEAISQEDYNKLKDLPGMSVTQLDDMMDKNKVSLEQSGTTPDNNNNVADSAPSSTVVAQQFGVKFEITPIQVPMAPSPNPNGISPAAKYESFADSLDFTKTNDPSSTTNSYDPVAVKQAENAPMATSGFAAALVEKPDESGTSTPKIDGLTPLQAEQIRMQEENQRQSALAALSAQNTGGNSGGIAG